LAGWTQEEFGHLGGTDSCALFINDHSQVAGNSFTDSIVNPGSGFPTLHPFFWDGDELKDVGALGVGNFATASAFNSHGQIAGASNLADDFTVFHVFLWEGGKLTDFGGLGGNSVEVIGLNEKGEIVGKADLAGSQTHHAFLGKNGTLVDLGSQDDDPCSVAMGINSKEQIVGASTDCSNALHAFLWENGQMIDLDVFVPPSSTLTLTQATFINDRGEISAQGVLPNGNQRGVLLIPCDENHPNIEDCDYSLVEASATVNVATRMPGANMPATASSGVPPEAIRQLLQSVGSTPWRRRFGAQPQR